MKLLLFFILFTAVAALHPVKDFRVKDIHGKVKPRSKRPLLKQVDNDMLNNLPSTTKQISTTSSLPSSLPTIELSDDIQIVSTDNTKSIYYLNTQIIHGAIDYNETFQLLLDTGSSVTWLFNESCTSDACNQNTVKKFNDFSSPLKTSSTFHLSYSGQDCSGDLINGEENGMDVLFNQYNISDFTFGLASEVPDLFNGFNVSGILGIPASNNKNVDRNLIHQLNDVGLIDKQMFGLSLVSSSQTIKYIDSDSNLLDLPSNYGGLMISGSKALELKEKFISSDSDIFFTKTISNTNDYWVINLKELTVNNGSSSTDFSTSDNDRDTIVDTGTTGFVLPIKDADNLHKLLFGDSLISDDKGNYAFPCDDTDKNVTFNVDGHDFAINVNDFKGKEYTKSGLEGQCASMIQGLDSQYWVFGAAFLSKYYTVFDLEKSRIGFADSRISSYTLQEADELDAISYASKNSSHSESSSERSSSTSRHSSSSTTMSGSSSSNSSSTTTSTSEDDESSGAVFHYSGLIGIISLALYIL